MIILCYVERNPPPTLCTFNVLYIIISTALLQYAVGCRTYLFSVVGSFRVNVLADAESVFFVVGFVTSGKMS